DEIYRVRTPMPSTASYRYTAKVEPTVEARQTCSFEPFVERQWNRSFVWVQIPQTGNVTVPEDYYEQFTSKLGTEPPNYPGACKVLVEAAAADTVATTSPDLDRTLELPMKPQVPGRELPGFCVSGGPPGGTARDGPTPPCHRRLLGAFLAPPWQRAPPCHTGASLPHGVLGPIAMAARR